jgi:hypothetical protein
MTLKAYLASTAWALALAAGVLAGCTATPEPTPSAKPETTPNPDFFFPQRPAPPPGQHSVLLVAPHQGTLTFEDDCIWLRSGEGRHLVLWGSEHSAGWFDGRLVILESGRAVARVGDTVSISGGELTRQDVPQADLQVEATIGAKIPPQCRTGLYWRVGGIERVR